MLGALTHFPARKMEPAPLWQVCPVCFAFATEDAAELNAHSEACFARAAEREERAAPAAEAHYLRFLAYRSLSLAQTTGVLLTLNALGTTFRMGLALSSPRWSRTDSSLGSVPMLHSVTRDGLPPMSALRVPEETALAMCRALFPAFAFLRFPVMLALFWLSTSPSRRQWCARRPASPWRRHEGFRSHAARGVWVHAGAGAVVACTARRAARLAAAPGTANGVRRARLARHKRAAGAHGRSAHAVRAHARFVSRPALCAAGPMRTACRPARAAGVGFAGVHRVAGHSAALEAAGGAQAHIP
jgi:hypothetical protein